MREAEGWGAGGWEGGVGAGSWELTPFDLETRLILLMMRRRKKRFRESWVPTPTCHTTDDLDFHRDAT